LEVARRCCTV